MTGIRKLLLTLVLAWLASASAMAQAISGYTRHLWQSYEGLPEQTVQSFAQTQDGFLWIGTSGGLVRFDGASFTRFDRQNTPALHENSIFCLMVARDGSLWIGTEGGGILRYRAGHFSNWNTQNGMSNDFVRAIHQDSHGTIWAGTDNGLLRFNGTGFTRVDDTAEIPSISVHAIYEDRMGRLWAGGFKLAAIEQNKAHIYTLGPELSQNMVKSITQSADGTLWVGTVAGLEAMHVGESGFHTVAGVAGTVRCLQPAPDGTLWIGTIGKGAYQFANGHFTHLSAPAQLPSNTVLNFFEDSEKNFWIGTQTGMLRLTRSPASIVPLPQQNDSDFGTLYKDRDGSLWIGSSQLFHLQNGSITTASLSGGIRTHVRNLFRDRTGALWVGTDGDGLFRLAAGKATHITNLSNNFVRAMAEAPDGSMWIATDGGLNHLLPKGASFSTHTFGTYNGLTYGSIRSLLIDHRGDLWVGTERGVSHLRGETILHDASIAPLTQMKVWTLHEDDQGSLWFGTRDNGLYRLHAGQMAHFTTADGLASNAIYQILEDRNHHFWMSGPNEISLVNRQDLDAQANRSVRHLAITLYSVFEMESNTEIYGGTQPAGAITASGDVWFPSSRGPIHISPSGSPLLPPPVLHLQASFADGRPPAAEGPIALEPGSGRLEFSFAPIRLRAQNGLRFRYKLDGFDKDWSPATSTRTADYTNLPSGHYRFRVAVFDVGNPDAVYETSIDVVQKPYFYRTWWFIALCLLAAGLIALAAYRIRMRQLQARFAAVLEERNRLAREMHDTVIQGCTGVSALLEAMSMEGATHRTEIAEFAGTQLRATIDEARTAIWNLRETHTDRNDLTQKLASMAAQMQREFHLPVLYNTTGEPFALTPPRVHDLLMAAREAVFNALRHGSPQQVLMELEFAANDLLLRISDDGCGFDSGVAQTEKQHHFGLRGMQERVARSGGDFQLTTAPGAGVRIEIRLPRRSARHA